LITAAEVTARLRTIEDPCSVSNGTPVDIVSFGLVDEVRGGTRPYVRLRLTEPTCLYRLWFHRQVRAAVGVDVEVGFTVADDFWEPVVLNGRHAYD
jgi:metal-sulfur cluster biosynthetic enzyme